MNPYGALAATVMVTAAGFISPVSPARAELVLSQLVIELAPGERTRADVEVWNDDKERAFVAVDPREVLNPGTPSESDHVDPDPEKLGLLVSPARMILEPGQRKLLRIASIGPSGRERVYRVTVKPIIGQLAAQTSGLKLLVGYDVLVLVRPPEPKPHVSGVRSGDKLKIRNDGNVSVELVDGRQCDMSMKQCEALAGGRLYSGSEKTVEVPAGRRAEFEIRVGTTLTSVQF